LAPNGPAGDFPRQMFSNGNCVTKYKPEWAFFYHLRYVDVWSRVLAFVPSWLACWYSLGTFY